MRSFHDVGIDDWDADGGQALARVRVDARRGDEPDATLVGIELPSGRLSLLMTHLSLPARDTAALLDSALADANDAAAEAAGQERDWDVVNDARWADGDL